MNKISHMVHDKRKSYLAKVEIFSEFGRQIFLKAFFHLSFHISSKPKYGHMVIGYWLRTLPFLFNLDEILYTSSGDHQLQFGFEYVYMI